MYDGLKALEVPRRPRRPGRRRVLKIGLILALAFVVGVSGVGLYLYDYVNDRINRAKDPSIITDEILPDEPVNVLVLGLDRRDVVPAKERRQRQFRGAGGNLTDTILLVHISPKAERAVVLSFPRDLRVEIPGCGVGKINAAYACGGEDPNRTIRTIRQLTGLKIHHYVMINFVGFRDIVDAVGGIELCVRRAYDDPKSGLKIPEPGCHTLDGNMALSWVRSRAIDPRADLARVERQQQFLRLLMSRVKSVGFLLNVPKVMRFANALPDGVTISENVDAGVARAVAQKLSANQRAVDFRIVPNRAQYIGGVSYLIAVEDQATSLFRAIRRDEPLPDVGKTEASLPSPRDITVRILNGTDMSGLAARERDRLRELGFRVVSIGDAPSRYERTILTFGSGKELRAQIVEEHYPEADVRAVERDLPADVVITLGADYAATVQADSA